MRRLALGLLMAAVVATPALADYTVSGTCLYVDREFDENGFTGVEPTRPIRFAVVQVVLAGNNKVDASGETDANGDFSFTVVDNRTRDIYVRCLARHEAPAGIPVEVRSEMQAATRSGASAGSSGKSGRHSTSFAAASALGKAPGP